MYYIKNWKYRLFVNLPQKEHGLFREWPHRFRFIGSWCPLRWNNYHSFVVRQYIIMAGTMNEETPAVPLSPDRNIKQLKINYISPFTKLWIETIPTPLWSYSVFHFYKIFISIKGRKSYLKIKSLGNALMRIIQK